MAYLYRDGRVFEGTPTVIDANRATVIERDKCHRCGGAGGWKGWPEFTCYRCNGKRYEDPKTVKLYSAEKLQKLNATRDKARAKKEAEHNKEKEARKAEQRAKFDEWLESYDGKGAAHVIKSLEGLTSDLESRAAEIVESIADQFKDRRPLTENQISVLFQIRDRTQRRVKEKKESRYAADVGETIEIEGECKLVWEDPWGAYGWKGIFIIKTRDGIVAKYVGSKSLGNGQTIRLKATVKAHEDDRGVKQTVISRPRDIRAAH